MTSKQDGLLHGLTRKSTRALNLLLSALETLLVSKSTEAAIAKHPPIFIVGAPRSGSTLLYQLMSEYFDVGFISNLLCTFWGAPSLIQSISGQLSKPSSSNFHSEYGKTKGRGAPSECGEYWYRFFRRTPQYVPLTEADDSSMERLRRAVGGLTAAFDRTMVFKNLMNSVRVQPLAYSLPEALFIVVERDEAANAYSIMQGRMNALGNYDDWWSLEPPNIALLRHLPAAAQAVEQVRSTYECIATDARVIGRERFLHIHYEELCNDAPSQLLKIHDFLLRHQVHVGRRNDVPQTFKQSISGDREDDIYSDIRNYLDSVKRNDER